jgi:hypothetical protein
MMMTSADDLVAGYLDRLARASADLPSSYREELLEQIGQHIAAARSDEHALAASFTGLRGVAGGLIVLTGLGVSLAAGAQLVRRARDRTAG